MSNLLTPEEVNELVAKRLARDRKNRSSEIAALHQQIVRLSAENTRLRDRLTETDTRATRSEGAALQHAATITRRDQTISALRAQLTERSI